MQLVRRLEFDAGHRLPRHAGKCRHVHGHRYRVELVIEGPEQVDPDGYRRGMAIDFGTVRRLVGGWIDEHLDHRFLAAPDEDPALLDAIRRASNDPAAVIVCPLGPPTAENLAAWILQMAQSLLPAPWVVQVTVFETPNCWAVARSVAR